MKEYDTYIDREDSISDGVELELTVRDLTPGRYKYEMKRVKAVISKSADKLPEADKLWLRYPMGDLYPDPWFIKIL